MTEAEWLAYTSVWQVDVHRLPDFSYRQLFHFLGAALPSFTAGDVCPACRDAVKLIAREADAAEGRSSLAAEALLDRRRFSPIPAECGIHRMVYNALHCAAGNLLMGECWNGIVQELHVRRGRHADVFFRPGAQTLAILRDIVGNPFRPCPIDPRWLAWQDGTVAALSRTAYDNLAFDMLPILGDALEDAGCADGEILAHLRGPGPHVRGCWALDLLLGDS